MLLLLLKLIWLKLNKLLTTSIQYTTSLSTAFHLTLYCADESNLLLRPYILWHTTNLPVSVLTQLSSQANFRLYFCMNTWLKSCYRASFDLRSGSDHSFARCKNSAGFTITLDTRKIREGNGLSSDYVECCLASMMIHGGADEWNLSAPLDFRRGTC